MSNLELAKKWAALEASRSGLLVWFQGFDGSPHLTRDMNDDSGARWARFGTSNDPEHWDGGWISIPISRLQEADQPIMATI